MPTLPAATALAPRAVGWGVVAVFGTVWLGMFLGGLPRLELDRSGVALLGSIANLVVVDLAGKAGVRIGWRRHARTGIPVTLVSLALVSGWLALLG